MLYLRSAVRAYALKYGISEDEVANQLRAKQPDARFESETAPAIQEPEPMEPIASDPLSTPTPRTSLKTPTTAETAPSMGAESSPVKNTDYMGGIGRAASGIASDPMAFADEVTTGLGDGLVEGSKQVYKSMLQSTKATKTALMIAVIWTSPKTSRNAPTKRRRPTGHQSRSTLSALPTVETIPHSSKPSQKTPKY